MRVDVEIVEEEVENEFSRFVDGLRLICARCGHEVTVYGTSGSSAKRGAFMLREECLNGESNFYDVSDFTD